MKSSHLLVCVALVVGGAVLLSTGAGAFAVLPLLLCGAIMRPGDSAPGMSTVLRVGVPAELASV